MTRETRDHDCMRQEHDFMQRVLKTLRWIMIPVVAMAVAACAPVSIHQDDELERHPEPITVRVSGFGTYENAAVDSMDTRKRLLARRASQLDAYRNLAERVYGTVIFGSSTVNDFVLRNDMFRTYVDSYIRGAETIAVDEHSDGVFETVMELKLAPRFLACAAKVSDEKVRDLCPIPMPPGNDSVGDVQSRNVDSLYYLD